MKRAAKTPAKPEIVKGCSVYITDDAHLYFTKKHIQVYVWHTVNYVRRVASVWIPFKLLNAVQRVAMGRPRTRRSKRKP